MEKKTTRNKQEASQIPAAYARDEEEENRIITSSLPDDAILHILSKLPTKSVLRFRCVCKHWCYNLFKDSNLVKAHLNNLLVGIFVDRPMPLYLVQSAFSTMVTISIHNHTSFVLDFKNSDDYRLVLEKRLIYIGNSLFIVRQCSPLIQKNLSDLKTIPIWVFIYGVPFHLWNAEGLTEVSSCLGVYLMADDDTINRTRLRRARVCVQIDLDFTYPSSIPLLNDGTIEKELPVKYDFKPPKCDGCKIFGHYPSNCPTKGLNEKDNKEQLNT